jgi:hypothetical protein
VQGIGRWTVGHRNAVIDIGGFGAVYVLAGVLLVGASLAVLLARYRRIER